MKGERGVGRLQGFQGEVHVKTSGLYHVQNWSYGQKTKTGDILTFSIFQISSLPKNWE